MNINKYLAVDLDGTLAEYHGWINDAHIGTPVPAIVEALKQRKAEGWKVYIFTARVSSSIEAENETNRCIIMKWLGDNDIAVDGITATKHKYFTEFWDDRAVQVIPNMGKFVNRIDIDIEQVPSSSMDVQVDGNHYARMVIQPAEYSLINGLGAVEAMVIKYISRHHNKNGKKDLEKAKHFIDMLIEHEYEGTFHKSLMKRMEAYDANSKKD